MVGGGGRFWSRKTFCSGFSGGITGPGQALGVNTPKIIVIFSRNFTGIFLET